jgi:hypothetical protein
MAPFCFPGLPLRHDCEHGFHLARLGDAAHTRFVLGCQQPDAKTRLLLAGGALRKIARCDQRGAVTATGNPNAKRPHHLKKQTGVNTRNRFGYLYTRLLFGLWISCPGCLDAGTGGQSGGTFSEISPPTSVGFSSRRITGQYLRRQLSARQAPPVQGQRMRAS